MEGNVTIEQQNDGFVSADDMKEVQKQKSIMRRKDGSNKEMSNKEIEEQKKVSLMRALVEKQDPSSKDFDDLMIRRFLRARDLNIERASSMFLRYLEWRRTFIPNGSISISEIPNEIAQNKIFMQGSDKSGRPVMLLFGGRHIPNKKGGLDEFKRFVVFSMEKVCSRIPEGHEKFVIIGDLEGWGFPNSDVRGYIEAVSILQDYYPERLGKMIILHVPNIFMTVWKMVYPFITKSTKEKIVFVENKVLKSTLLKDIDESQLPELYGGKMKMVPVHDC